MEKNQIAPQSQTASPEAVAESEMEGRSIVPPAFQLFAGPITPPDKRGKVIQNISAKDAPLQRQVNPVIQRYAERNDPAVFGSTTTSSACPVPLADLMRLFVLAGEEATITVGEGTGRQVLTYTWDWVQGTVGTALLTGRIRHGIALAVAAGEAESLRTQIVALAGEGTRNAA